MPNCCFVASATGSGSIADGETAVTQLMDQAGVPRAGYELADGSGMSSYNRVTPRATATLLRWIAGQDWSVAVARGVTRL